MKLIDYIKGIRKGKDAHRIEYDAMSDPFLADAIDGFDSVDGNHAHRIAQIQAAITSKTTKKNRNGVWQIAVAAVALIVVVTGYFSLMNHESSMMVAHCDNCFINIYAPEDYIQRKRLELTLQQEINPKAQLTSIVNIENLREVISPIERMPIYIPGDYAYNNNVEEEKEIASYESKRSDKDQNKIIEASYSDINNYELPTESVATLDEVSESRSNEAQVDLAQNRNVIKGKIVDEKGNSINGASIIEKGTNNGSVTDIDGFYSIETDTESTTLVASYLGYETVEIPDHSKARVVALKPDNSILDEVVVIDYGNQKKKSLTGAVSSVSLGEMKNETKQVSKPVIGEKKFKKYLKENQHRKNEMCDDAYGIVTLEFTIGVNGRPQDIKVIRSLCEVLDKDAIRLLESGSDWTLGTEKVVLNIDYK